MTTITDEYMYEMLPKTKAYSIVILRPGPKAEDTPEVKKIIWEHGRRNFALRADGLLSIVCPIREGNVDGVGIFNASLTELTSPSQKGLVITTSCSMIRKLCVPKFFRESKYRKFQ